MWACGAILLAMLAPGLRREGQAAGLLESPALAHVSDNTRWLLARLLHDDPAERPTAAEARLFVDGMLAAGIRRQRQTRKAEADASAIPVSAARDVALDRARDIRRARLAIAREQAVMRLEHESARKWTLVDNLVRALGVYWRLVIPYPAGSLPERCRRLSIEIQQR